MKELDFEKLPSKVEFMGTTVYVLYAIDDLIILSKTEPDEDPDYIASGVLGSYSLKLLSKYYSDDPDND